MKMNRFFFLLLLVALMPVAALAQYDFLTAHRGVIKGGYDFWVYTPEDYYYSQEQTPVVIFLHGASPCCTTLFMPPQNRPRVVFSFSVSLLICFPTWSAISRSTVQS